MLFLTLASLVALQFDVAVATSSSSSSSSSSTSSTKQANGQTPNAQTPVPRTVNLDLDGAASPEGRVDATMRRAAQGDQRSVYLWTFPRTAEPGRATPSQFSRDQFANILLGAYESTGRIVNQWSVFLEVHATSRSEFENNLHFHALVETSSASRWAEVAQFSRDRHQVYANVLASP